MNASQFLLGELGVIDTSDSYRPCPDCGRATAYWLLGGGDHCRECFGKRARKLARRTGDRQLTRLLKASDKFAAQLD